MKFLVLAILLATIFAIPAMADYATVSIAEIANLPEDLATPKGNCELGGVPFDLIGQGNGIALTEDEYWTQFPTSFHLPVAIDGPQTVYALLACHYCYLGYNNQTVGKFVFRFEDGTNQEVSLVAGYNIRACIEGPMWLNTTTSPSTQEVWAGTIPDGRAVSLDMITIQTTSRARLTGIDIIDTSAQTTVGHAAGIGLRGITVQTVPEPSSILVIGSGLIGFISIIRRKK